MATFDFQDLNTIRSVEDLVSYQKEVQTQITSLDSEKSGLPFNDEERTEYANLTAADADISKRVTELEARRRDVERFAQRNGTERESVVFETSDAKGSNKERDIYDLSAMRVDPMNPSAGHNEFRDRAKRSVDISHFPLTLDPRDARAYGVTTDGVKERLGYLLDERDTDQGYLARRILVTGSPAYRRAYAKIMTGESVVSLTREEQTAVDKAQNLERAFTLGSTGLPVPYQLDPTIIPTSNSVVNPWRAICRVEPVVVNEWRGATSGAITAAYAAEGTEASDNTPTLTQPTVPAVRAQAFVPYSRETGQDWGALQTEMARLIADAKDDLESNKFFSGSGTNEPTGINAATTGINTTTVGVAAFVIADLYAVEAALAPRFRARASIVANRSQYSRVRQFDTAGGAGMWMQVGGGLANNGPTPGNLNQGLLGYPTYESSQMLSVLTTGSRIMLIGDFRHYLIAERVGMSIEVIPNLFGASGRPTGQSGVYAFWRNGGKLLAESAFRFLITQ